MTASPRATVIVGDCREVLASMDADSVDAIVTDPPYGIGMMNQEWDTFAPDAIARRTEQNRRKTTNRGSVAYPDRVGQKSQGGGVPLKYDESPTGNQRFQAWCTEWARECLRVLKPGGHMLVCGGPRTFHRLTSGIEDAGFQIRDVLTWLFGVGFPKSRNLDGEWQGWGTALKPGWEPIVLARKPLDGTVLSNAQTHGTGVLNIDACRIAGPIDVRKWGGTQTSESPTFARLGGSGFQTIPHAAGRWPANVALDEAAAEALDGAAEEASRPSRFFFSAKVSRSERNAGLEGMPEGALCWSSGTQSPGTFQSDHTARSAANHHPTVKPIALMRWLIRMVTPAGGVVLDPFAGSCSTLCAAVLEHVRAIGVEVSEVYAEIGRRRIDHWSEVAQQESRRRLAQPSLLAEVIA